MERVLSLIFSLRRWMMLGFSTLRGSNAESPHHVYELRLYQWFIKAVFDDGSENAGEKVQFCEEDLELDF